MSMNLKELSLPIFIVLIFSAFISIFTPFIPIDETRYISVAWDMQLYHSFIVPIINGVEYSHKPPFLFWLINCDWKILGVNGWSLRFIPALFSIINLLLVYKLSDFLWGNKRISYYSSLFLSTTSLYLLWSGLIMFDVILTTWCLLAWYYIFRNSREFSYKNSCISGIALGMGILTKGPVIFVYVLPIAILLPFLTVEFNVAPRKWFNGLFTSFIVSLILLSLWLIPALYISGAEYREAILWKQTAGRVVKAFAHQRAFWWYIPLIPLYLFPWGVFPSIWKKQYWETSFKKDGYFKVLISIVFSTFIIFSIISSKQLHYLLPVVPFISILLSKLYVANGLFEKVNFRVLAYYLTTLFLVILFLLLVLVFIKGNVFSGYVGFLFLLAISFDLILIYIIKNNNVCSSYKLLVVSVLSSLLVATLVTKGLALDITPLAKFIEKKQLAGYHFINLKQYHAQYQFLGRLKTPLEEIRKENILKKKVKEGKIPKKTLVITYKHYDKYKIDDNDKKFIAFSFHYLNKIIIVWDIKKWE